MESHWAEQGSSRHERMLRVDLLNRVLRHFGLGLSDWSGAVYLLRDGKGRTAVVEDLGSLWRRAEELAGRKLDPLDPGLVAGLSRPA
jgi:hypothetical protein